MNTPQDIFHPQPTFFFSISTRQEKKIPAITPPQPTKKTAYALAMYWIQQEPQKEAQRYPVKLIIADTRGKNV